jgi:hypothetical protein
MTGKLSTGRVFVPQLTALALVTLLAALPLFSHSGAQQSNLDQPDQQIKSSPLSSEQEFAVGCLTILPCQVSPASIPWESIKQLESLVVGRIAESDPVAFLQQGLTRYKNEVQGYRCIFDKQEKVNGKLLPQESILIHFREKPFSVHMEWKQGGKAFRTLYDVDHNDKVLLARPSRLVSFSMYKQLTANDVKSSSRFGVDKFGMFLGAKDTVEHMVIAQDKKMLHLKYLGKFKLGERVCYKFVRSPYDTPEGLPGENLNELTIYVDAETRMQVRSILKDNDGNLIADYYFRDIVVNPTFDAKQFTQEGL